LGSLLKSSSKHILVFLHIYKNINTEAPLRHILLALRLGCWGLASYFHLILLIILFLKQDDGERRYDYSQGTVDQKSKRKHSELLRFQSEGMEFVRQELGKGAYGVVYKAKEKVGGEWRAIKKIAKKNIKNPELFLNEIDILKEVNHPTCIKLYETFEDAQNVFLVTEYSLFYEVYAREANCSIVLKTMAIFQKTMPVKSSSK
jgi:hypothetical protein